MTEAELEEAEREKSAPMPLRLTAWLAPALSVTLRVPLRLPTRLRLKHLKIDPSRHLYQNQEIIPINQPLKPARS